MQPFVVRNSHAAPMDVLIQPGQISMSLPAGHVLEIQVFDLENGKTIEICPDSRPGLTLIVPSSQFKIRSGASSAQAA